MIDHAKTIEHNRKAVKAAQAETSDGYIADRLCPSTSGGDRCGWLRGHEGLHVGTFGAWCDRAHPCIGQRESIDFERHPNHWVCPRCSGGAS